MTSIINNDIDRLVIRMLDPISALVVGRTNRSLHALVEDYLKLVTRLDLSLPPVGTCKKTKNQYSTLFSGDRFKNLKVLSLKNRRDLDMENLATITEQCAELERVDLSGCRSMGDTSISLLLNCKELKFLSLACTRITNAGFTLLTKGYPNLKQLNLSGCSKIRFPSRPSLNCFECIVTPSASFTNERRWSIHIQSTSLGHSGPPTSLHFTS